MKKTLKNLRQTDGKVAERKGNFKSLDEIFGFNHAKYPTHDEAKYSRGLSDMNLADLYKEAVRVGLLPTDNRNLLVERLMKEFKRTTAGVLTSDMKPVQLKPSKKAMEILGDARSRGV